MRAPVLPITAVLPVATILVLLTAGCSSGEPPAGPDAPPPVTYTAEGGGGDFQGTGIICSLTEEFVVEGSGVVMTFEPRDAEGGTYSYVGEIAGFAVAGGEEYAVEYEDGVPVGIKGWGVGSVTGAGISQSGYGEEHYELTPNDEVPDECAGT